jgi:hypothetical protein
MAGRFLPPQEPVWRPVVGFEGRYEISDAGDVRSLDRVATYTRRDQYSGRDLTVERHHRGRMLRPAPSDSGHLSVVVGRGNTRAIHIMVLEAFVGPAPNGAEGRHLDGDPSHNAVDNLSWGTRSESVVSALKRGRAPRGSSKFNAKLSEQQIPSIRAAMATDSYAEIARRHGVTEATIRQVRDGKTWRHA